MIVIALILMAASLIVANPIKKRFGMWAPAALFLVVCLLCELVCFNFESLRSQGYSPLYEDKDYNVFSTADPKNRNSYEFDSTADYIQIDNLDCDVENIYLETNKTYDVIKIVAIDDANTNWYTAGSCALSGTTESTSYIRTNFSGNVHNIRIYISDLKDEKVVLSNLSLNVPKPIYFSALRVLICFAILLFIYYIIVLKDFWQAFYEPTNKRQNTITVVVAVSLAVLFLVIPFTNPSFISPRWKHHTQYNKLAEALIDGQLHLEEVPPEELVNMDNPYDRTERARVLNEAGIKSGQQPWDVAYYNGKYYVYFGVLPAIIFYVPFNLMGVPFPNFMGVVLFSWLLIAGVFLLYREFIKHYEKKVPYLLYLLLAITTVVSGGVIYMIKRPDFYSVPIMGGLAFSVMGYYFWLSAKGKDGVLNSTRLMIGSIFMACVIALRPNLVFYSCGAFVIFWNSVFRDRELLSLTSRLKDEKYRGLKNTLMFCAPYIIIGGLVMAYNMARFGSPFEFGAAYNLTLSDMTLRGFEVDRWNLGIFEYLFRPPTITSEFPFITPSVAKTAYIGYTSCEKMYGGIFATHAILWALFGLYKIRNEKPFKFASFLVIASFFVCLLDIQAGGNFPRYTSDFAIFFVMAAVVVLFLIYEQHTRFTGKFVAVCLLCMIGYDVLLIIGSGASSTADLHANLYSSAFSELVFFL